ncbi:hypothetical protein MZ018_04205 [Shewanella sp. JNE10-2]|nr:MULTISPECIES: hypothetical protein [unclassified Shewanella]UPO28001.1 hypothetical protein MZ018_04205 [Shewanella sp. JNE10-2]UPO35208.1 hypothetical protein MZ097_19870 [Shewanella sp. JNE7]
MSYSKIFKELDKSLHDRASFDCGEAELNDFIQTQAAKHMQAGISRTMAAFFKLVVTIDRFKRPFFPLL